jgi:quercetin dioxygenase-like cupin family protein
MPCNHAAQFGPLPSPMIDRYADSGDITVMKAVRTVQIDTPRVIVTEWAFAPGAETGQHVHRMDYVVVPLTSGALRLIESESTRDAQLTAGVSYCRPAGVDHNVINVNAYEFRFLEIELK